MIGDIMSFCTANIMMPVCGNYDRLMDERFSGNMVDPGFLCCNYMAHSLEAGSIRALCR
jgi:hypothetical protein